ncbi:hypothetical protein TNCV_2271701 [Trichonephila clavipes]|nr:hypothetical protein TNCV_2271701 [Trichonephila clavipes]
MRLIEMPGPKYRSYERWHKEVEKITEITIYRWDRKYFIEICTTTEDNNKTKSNGTLDELNIIRMQSLYDYEGTLSDNSQLLTEIESLRKQVELLSNSSKQSSLPMPPPSQIDPNIAAILSTIMKTQNNFYKVKSKCD